ncbi:MAG: GNAT family N-acetyltransferase [Caulobacteraceae bacterium]
MNEAEAALAWSLEAAFDAAWPALQVIAAGDWLCKSAPGVSRRSNSANPAGAHARLTEAGIERIEAVYARLGQPTYVRLPSLVGVEPDSRLAARGYGAEGHSLTLVGPLPAEAPADEVELSSAPSPEWLAVLNRINGREGETAKVFDSVLAGIDVPAAFGAVRREGRIVSAAYAAASDGWLCLEAVATDSDWRGRGLAGQTVAALMAWGAKQGARAAGLQVQADNAAAQALYRRLGLGRELYRYHYRKAPQEAP